MLAINVLPWRSTKVRESETPESGTTLSRFRSEMDRLFDQFFGDEFFGLPARSEGQWPRGWWPSADVTERDDEVLVRAELPGVDPEDLDVTISGDVLTISGEKRETEEEREENYYRSERRFGSFRRSMPLPTSVDPDSVEAEYRNGVLTVHLEKTETAQPKRIPVKATK